MDEEEDLEMDVDAGIKMNVAMITYAVIEMAIAVQNNL